LIGSVASTALSANGNRVAIGGFSLVNGTGRVRLYDWEGSQWVMVSPDFVGSQRFGQGVALSSDGNRVAIGICSTENKEYGLVRIYDWAGSQWSQVGSDLVGEVAGDWFGSDIAMSSDGNRVAIAASSTHTGDDTSHVQIFDWSGTQWTQAGSNLDVNGSINLRIALSSDGNRVAIGSLDSEKKSIPYAGLVRIYDWTGNQWTQVGSNLIGEADGDGFGSSVAISSNGNRIAVGALWYNGRTGYVRMYDWTTRKQWIQVGADLIGSTTDQFFGSITDGNRVVIGVPSLHLSGHTGHVEIYDWMESQWRKTGSDLVGHDATRGGYGTAVVISSNGNGVAILAYFNSGPVTSYVRLFDLGESCS